jgi:hypothetical protein
MLDPITPTYFIVLQLFVLALSVVTALLEIQIEGAHGWAAKLPTWRYNSSWVKIFYNGKELTGYHLYLNLHLLLLLHLPLVLTGWSLFLELTVLSIYFSYMTFWDFLWFALNPAYGLKCFGKGNIWWFEKWIGPFPFDYYFMLFISGLLAGARGFLPEAGQDSWYGGIATPFQHYLGWMLSIGIAIGCIALIIRVFAPYKPQPFCLRIDRPKGHVRVR